MTCILSHACFPKQKLEVTSHAGVHQSVRPSYEHIQGFCTYMLIDTQQWSIKIIGFTDIELQVNVIATCDNKLSICPLYASVKIVF